MDFRLSVTRHRPVYVLLGTLLLSAVLVLGIALEYAYDAFSRIAAAAGFAVLLVTLGGTWRMTRTTRYDAAPTPLDAMTRLGLLLGMLWVIEIGINNVIAPPLPGRDTIDNLFWGLIALGILAASAASAFRSGRLRRGIVAGAWTGFVSGAVACGTGLALIALGMSLLRSDPVNLAEWANRAADSTAPTLAAYLAYETLAGAFLHLIVLGLGMGVLLGVAGGALGALAKRARPGGQSLSNGPRSLSSP
jgi:hypothetical protein